MEAAVASGVLKVAVGKLVHLITKLVHLITGEFTSIMGVTEDLSELQDLFGQITAWLSAVGDIAIADTSLRWVKKLENVAYDIDDLLYEAHLEAEKHKTDGDGDIHHVMANCFCAKPKSVVFRCKMSHKIKTIKKRFAAIKRQREEFNAIINNVPVDRPDRRNNRTFGEMSILGNVGKSAIRVRDEEKHRIISKLVETNEREKILTVSIVGLGGSGKTTLAKHICEDKKIKEHFQDAIYRVDVSSEEFDVWKLVGKLFEAVAKKKSDLETNQKMVQEISDKLNHKKFLLVLDDAWHEDRHDWEQFMDMGYLNSGAPGSRILLTTRNKRVSEAVKSTYSFELELLQLDDSWEFFQQCSGWAEEAMDSELIEVGKDIVSKCGGVPLAIKTLAGVLSCNGEREINTWRAIRDSNLLSVPDIQNRVMGSLMLSYFHLRDDLKQCFVLCSIFPKGYMIDREQLIDQWIAHDMITPTDGVDNLDLKYKWCFNTLAQMSFLQDVTENYEGRVTCRMHDLVHDLARSILSDEISLAVPDKTIKATKSYARYFSLIKPQGNVPPKHFFVKGRAMYVAKGDFIFGKVLKNAKYLRSITVEYIYTEPVLTYVLQIKNLRYLAISQPACETLPEAISDIWSLQALHVTNSQSLRELPKSIGKLQKLRTLNLSGCTKLESLPDSIGDCQMISTVDLYGCRGLTTISDSIGRNKNLRVLRLRRTRIERLPSSITTLGNLEILDLEECAQLVELPKGMNDLKKLEVLNLELCYKLSGIPVGFEQLSRLRKKLGMFVVGEGENFAKISELGNASGIGGHLTITNIVFVKDPDDAQKARLKHKTNLQSLLLDWSNGFSDLTGEYWSNDAEKELAVLNALEPPPSGIKSIHVNRYPGGQFARWILKQVDVGKDHPRFPCLTRVRLENFPNLKHLQGLAELPSLQELGLVRMPALESISGGPFPSLVRLEMQEMPSLEEVWMGSEDETFFDHGEGQQIQVQQIHLTIQKCPKLKMKPYLPSSLEYLRLHESNEQLLLSPFHQGQGSSNDAEGLPPSFSHLKRLDLSQMTASASSSSSPGSRSAGRGWELLQYLTALDSLHIESCEGLKELPESMRSLISLRFLDIHYCSHLRVLPEWLGELRSLQKMSIGDCNALHQLPESLGELRSLQEMSIVGCDALHQLPESLGKLHSLRSLFIQKLPCLSNLPHSLQHLTFLQELYIGVCEALHQLPESLGELRSLRRLSIQKLPCLSSLPQSLQHLTSLQEFEISHCKALQLLEWLGELRSLRMLNIEGLPCLRSLPHSLQHLTSLQKLLIGGCDALYQLPESLGELRSLRSLFIWSSPCLSSLPHSLQHLTSLQELNIGFYDALHQLPEWFGELRSLRRFKISRLPGLTGLPRSMRLLTSLEELLIEDCPGLTSLPEWIQGLTALQVLLIWGCPRLKSRCERGKGEDRRLVSHIPHLHLEW